MQLVELRNGVNIHTKINRDVKRTIETLAKTTDLDQNVIINSILTAGLRARMKRPMTRRK